MGRRIHRVKAKHHARLAHKRAIHKGTAKPKLPKVHVTHIHPTGKHKKLAPTIRAHRHRGGHSGGTKYRRAH